jgi:hypothetical protein
VVVTRSNVVALAFVALLGAMLVSDGLSGTSFVDKTRSPDDTVADFIEAFNDRDVRTVCALLTPARREAIGATSFHQGVDPDRYSRARDRWPGEPNALCFAGADAARSSVGPISLGATRRTFRESGRLAYADTERGRWKLTWDGHRWKVAGHPRLETLSDDVLNREWPRRHARARLHFALSGTDVSPSRKVGDRR